MKCPGCRGQLEADAAFCPHCGVRLLPGDDPTTRIPNHELVRELRPCSSGSLHEARHVHSGADRWIKIRALPGADREAAARRSWDELAAVARVRHRNLLATIDFGRLGEGSTYVVMEASDGDPLDALLEREGPLTPREAVAIATQVADGLTALLQAGIDVRGLAPRDVVVERLVDGWHVKILEVDSGGLRPTGAPTLPGQPEATAGWRARGAAGAAASGRSPSVREASPARSLALLAWTMLTGAEDPTLAGAPAPTRDEAVELAMRHLGRAGEVPEPVLAVLRQALGPGGDDAYPTPGDVARALAEAVGVKPEAAGGDRESRTERWQLAAAVVIVVAAAALVLVTREPQRPEPEPARGDLVRARALLQRGDHAGVVAELGGAAGASAEAEELLLRALEALATEGSAAARARAVALREATLRRDPMSLTALRALGRLHAQGGEVETAAGYLEAVVVAGASGTDLPARERADLLNDAAVAAATTGDVLRAEVLLSQVLALDPTHPRGLANRGVLHLDAGRLAAAERDLRAALAAEPRLHAARSALAAVLRRTGRLQDSRAALDEVLEADPENAAARNLLGVLAEDSGDLAAAREELARAARAQPALGVVQENLARVDQGLRAGPAAR
jgi:tetratricopeptide (TPR) repeat protein